MNRRYLILAALAVLIGVESYVRERYEKVIAVHVDVLSEMTGKASALGMLGTRPSPSDLTELMYPLERARQFIGEYRDEAERPSYQRFVAAVDAYEGLIMAIDAERGSADSWAQFRPLVAQRAERVRSALAAVRVDLAG